MKINLLKSLPMSWGKKRKKDLIQRKNVTKEDIILMKNKIESFILSKKYILAD